MEEFGILAAVGSRHFLKTAGAGAYSSARGSFQIASAREGPMDHRLSTLERAFQIARSGEVLDIQQLKRAVKKEGYAADQIHGRAISKQLRTIIAAATPATPRQPIAEVVADEAPPEAKEGSSGDIGRARRTIAPVR
jgi:hypothetical protein